MQLIAADDDTSGTNTNLARGEETSTLKETDLTSCPAAAHDDKEIALGIETQISTLTKSESECDVTEDGRDVEQTCDVEPGRQVKTKDQESKAVVSN